jgi:hypothetical protein
MPVDLSLGSRQCRLASFDKARCHGIHEVVRFSIGNGSCHPSVALCQIGVVVMAAQDGFERSISPDKSRQAFAAPTARKNAGTDLRLTEHCVLAAGVTQIAAKASSFPPPLARPRMDAMLMNGALRIAACFKAPERLNLVGVRIVAPPGPRP